MARLDIDVREVLHDGLLTERVVVVILKREVNDWVLTKFVAHFWVINLFRVESQFCNTCEVRIQERQTLLYRVLPEGRRQLREHRRVLIAELVRDNTVRDTEFLW